MISNHPVGLKYASPVPDDPVFVEGASLKCSASACLQGGSLLFRCVARSMDLQYKCYKETQ